MTDRTKIDPKKDLCGIVRLSGGCRGVQQFDKPELQIAPASWPYQSRALGILHLPKCLGRDLFAHSGNAAPRSCLSFSIRDVSLLNGTKSIMSRSK